MRKIKVQSPEDDFEPFQIHSRPLGNVVYIMTSLFTKPQVMRAMEKAVMGQLTSMQKQ
jgi:dethiobiotin synthetase/adenosylmethionine--8-amino-7-oxononanoate aminotransferase